MATWNPLARPVYARPAQEQPDFFGRTRTNAVRQLSLPKVPGADPMIRSSFSDAENLRRVLGRDLAGYRNAFAGTQPMASRFASEDVGEIGRYFAPGGYESELAGIRDRRSDALGGLNDRILGDLRRTMDSRAVATGNTGLGSYLSRMAASEAGRLRTQEAYDRAQQERSDLAALMAGRSAGIGRRQGVLDQSLARLLMPSQAEQAGVGAYNTNLANALQLALNNLVSAYATLY